MQRHLLTALIIVSICKAGLLAQTTAPNVANRFGEMPIPDGGRIVIDAPEYLDGRKPIRLICFALPNGNSIEQTAGATTRPGMDWHYDIQHIAAQTAVLRETDHARNYVVAYLESPKKSWPAWSASHPDDAPNRCRAIVASIEKLFFGRPCELELIAHSGGGSFLTHYLIAADPIPSELVRVGYIDAYYGTDREPAFAEIVHNWLASNLTHQFFLCCYDDRNITINGKRIIGEQGGSLRASRRLLSDLTQRPEPTSQTSERPPVTYLDFSNNQAHFVIHANPANLILHTRLVEWDGFLRAVTTGDSSLPQTWRELREQRSYEDQVPAEPIRLPTSHPSHLIESNAKPAELALTPRSTTAPAGHELMKRLATLPPDRVQPAIAAEILSGNVPSALREWRTIEIKATDSTGVSHFAQLRVLPDYLSIGTDDDFVRIPMLPATAQQIADALHCTLPTRKLVDDIYAAADAKLDPQPLTEDREAIGSFVQHNDLIQQQLGEDKLSGFDLIAGIKKDIVISPRLATSPGKVAIYGWHTQDSRAIQPLTTVHRATYADYSHGVRLIDQECTVDGKPTSVAAVLRDPLLCVLFSDEGASEVSGYVLKATTAP